MSISATVLIATVFFASTVVSAKLKAVPSTTLEKFNFFMNVPDTTDCKLLPQESFFPSEFQQFCNTTYGPFPVPANLTTIYNYAFANYSSTGQWHGFCNFSFQFANPMLLQYQSCLTTTIRAGFEALAPYVSWNLISATVTTVEVLAL